MEFLVFGSHGSVGSAMIRVLATRVERLTAYSHAPQAGQMLYDFRHDPPSTLLLRPDTSRVVCLVAALANIDTCLEQPELAHQMNVAAPLKLLEVFDPRRTTLVFMSSDNVFDGKHAPYVENDPVCAPNLYGEQKIILERKIRARFDQHLILRLGKVFGTWRENVLLQQARTLRSGRPITCLLDQIFAPVFDEDIPNFILSAIAKGVSGTYHLAENDSSSRYDQGLRLARALGAPESLVTPKLTKDFTFKARRPANSTLLNAKARADIDFRFSNYERMLTEIQTAL